MSAAVQNNTPTRQYSKICLETRMKLVEAVLSGRTSITKAAKKIGIKLSTAKLIVKKYRRDGTFHVPKGLASKNCGPDIDPSEATGEKFLFEAKTQKQGQRPHFGSVAPGDADMSMPIKQSEAEGMAPVLWNSPYLQQNFYLPSFVVPSAVMNFNYYLVVENPFL